MVKKRVGGLVKIMVFCETTCVRIVKQILWKLIPSALPFLDGFLWPDRFTCSTSMDRNIDFTLCFFLAESDTGHDPRSFLLNALDLVLLFRCQDVVRYQLTLGTES